MITWLFITTVIAFTILAYAAGYHDGRKVERRRQLILRAETDLSIDNYLRSQDEPRDQT